MQRGSLLTRSYSQISEALSGRKPLSTARPLSCEQKDTTLLRSWRLAFQERPTNRSRAFAVENGRVLVTLDADFANVIRFPPEQTLGVIRLKVHPVTEEA